MSDAKRRDDFVGRLAASVLAGGASAGECPDASRLAEWHEARPGSPAREGLAAHLASCARCQEVLVTLTRLDEVVQAPAAGVAAPAPVRPGSASWAWRWLLPAGAAAAAVTVWFIVRPPSGAIRPPAVSEAPATRWAEAQAPTASALPVSPSEPAEMKPGPRRKAEAAPAAPSSRGGAETPATASGMAGRMARAEGADALAVAIEAKPPAEAVRPSGEEMRAPTAAAPDNRVEAKAVAMRDVRRPPLVLEFASADGAVSWRVLPGNRVTWSTDAGRSWQSHDLDRSFSIRAGSGAPGGACWLVGSGGLVLLTVDGTAWTRLVPPADADLVDVEGRSALAATVVTADGRRFATDDGGRTWQLRRESGIDPNRGPALLS